MILVFETLQVIERGNHAQLISNPSSLYTDLWTKQHKIALESSSNWKTSDRKNNGLSLEEERKREHERRAAELKTGNVTQESDRRD